MAPKSSRGRNKCLYSNPYNIYTRIRYWMALWFCSFAIETTFPLSKFKNKHIFWILMARVKFSKLFGAPQAPQIFIFIFLSRPPRVGAPGAPNSFIIVFFYRRRRRRYPKWAPRAAPNSPLPRRAREIPPVAGVSRVYNICGPIFVRLTLYIILHYIKATQIFIQNCVFIFNLHWCYIMKNLMYYE